MCGTHFYPFLLLTFMYYFFIGAFLQHAPFFIGAFLQHLLFLPHLHFLPSLQAQSIFAGHLSHFAAMNTFGLWYFAG